MFPSVVNFPQVRDGKSLHARTCTFSFCITGTADSSSCLHRNLHSLFKNCLIKNYQPVCGLAVGGLAVGSLAVAGLAVDGLAVGGLAVGGLAVGSLAVSGLAVSGLAVDG